jgi:hypothetical protein
VKNLYLSACPPQHMVGPMDAAWAVLKSDPRMQAFSLTVPEMRDIQHPDSTPLTQTRLRNLGTVDPVAVKMGLKQLQDGWGNDVDEEQAQQVMSYLLSAKDFPGHHRNPVSLLSTPAYDGENDGEGYGGFNAEAGKLLPAPQAISRRPRPYSGAEPWEDATLADPSSPQGVINRYISHFGRNPSEDEMEGREPPATRRSDYPRNYVNMGFPKAMEASRSTSIGNPDNIQMLPEDFMQQV